MASTAVVYSLIEKIPNVKISTPYPSLLTHIDGISIRDSREETNDVYDVDLRMYTARRPHNSFPYRPSYIHMLEMAEEQLRIKLTRRPPYLYLTESEKEWAKIEVSKWELPLIWIQSEATSSNRLWPDAYWDELKNFFKDTFSFLDLSKANYSLRESLALIKYSYGGICLDSFLVHGAGAVGAKNVLVLLGSSRPECVTYPNQYVFYKPNACSVQPCGMHGYYDGCNPLDQSLFNGRNCIHTLPYCMNEISLDSVKNKLIQSISFTKSEDFLVW
ncbi:glycosyltransferase family 9 protein [Vibrio mediterranei]|uniref:glycosyltransferase family 9 protein n=1 Tax=Vibrio mediterranei TaxID=689 RepID=UPI00148CA58A|nr:hypothetical protein [Vibrio mediterranei]NOI26709.1 hypothetical protein [Vibrio mediterranei]